MIKLFKPCIAPNAGQNIQEVLNSGIIGESKQVEILTNKLQILWNHKNIVLLNSCTSALTLAMRLASHYSYPIVATSPFTMVATNCAIASRLSYIAWAKVDHNTLCLDTDYLIKNISRYHIIVITLVGGLVPLGFEKLLMVAKEKGVKIIIDAAHAWLTTYKNKHISHYGDYVCFSFQSIKHLNTGDGGAIVCNNDWEHERVKKLKWFGMSREVPQGKDRLTHQMTTSIDEWGYKFHMNDIAAALGIANFDLAIEATKQSQFNANYYQEVFQNNDNVKTLQIEENSQPAWWTYAIMVKTNQRDHIINKLKESNIESSPMWPDNRIHKAFNLHTLHKCYSKPLFVKYTPLFIPNGYWVNKEDREYIAKQINNL